MVPLTDMDGSDDSDEEDQIADKEPVFMVRAVHSLVPMLYEEEEKGPGTHCLCMRHVLRKTHSKITRKFSVYVWIKILTFEG